MKYYYLISSLPKLDIDDRSVNREHLEHIMELIVRNLSSEHLRVFQCLLHDNDNQNLLFILFREYHDFKIRAFKQPASISTDILENYRRESSYLPDYMVSYLNDLSGSFASMTMREMEQVLDQYLYDYIRSLDNTFLNTYFSWVYQLKKVVAEVNRKTFKFLHTTDEQEEPSFLKVQILHDLTEQTEIAGQLQPLIESKDFETIERKINAYYWEFANSWSQPFTAEQVYAYTIKLKRLHRWLGFSAKGDQSKARFEELVSEIKNKKSSPKMPVI